MESETRGTKTASSSLVTKVTIVIVLIAAVGFVILQKADRAQEETDKVNLQTPVTGEPAEQDARQSAEAAQGIGEETDGRVSLPSLVDLGSDTCVPCKMMAPILEELEEEYRGIFDVRFINTREDQEASSLYGIRLIPTQIFIDADGNELFRHEGFYSKEDILDKWQELGIDLEKDST